MVSRLWACVTSEWKALVYVVVYTGVAGVIIVAIRSAPSARPQVLAIAAPVIAGCALYLLTDCLAKIQRTRLLCRLIADEQADNSTILARIEERLALPFAKSGSTVIVHLPALRPYLPVWELATSGQAHYLPDPLVVTLTRVKRKLDYICRQLDYLDAEATRALNRGWTPNDGLLLTEQSKVVARLSEEARVMLGQLGKVNTSGSGHVVQQLWPVWAAVGLMLILVLTPR